MTLRAIKISRNCTNGNNRQTNIFNDTLYIVTQAKLLYKTHASNVCDDENLPAQLDEMAHAKIHAFLAAAILIATATALGALAWQYKKNSQEEKINEKDIEVDEEDPVEEQSCPLYPVPQELSE